MGVRSELQAGPAEAGARGGHCVPPSPALRRGQPQPRGQGGRRSCWTSLPGAPRNSRPRFSSRGTHGACPWVLWSALTRWGALLEGGCRGDRQREGFSERLCFMAQENTLWREGRFVTHRST